MIDIEKLAKENGFVTYVADDGECYADIETLAKFAEAYAAKVLEDKEREIAELKSKLKHETSRKHINELQAYINALREAGQAVVERWDSPNWSDGTHTRDYIYALKDAISKTPAQSLQAFENDVIEKCAKVCEEIVIENPGRADLTADQCAKIIRELKVSND